MKLSENKEIKQRFADYSISHFDENITGIEEKFFCDSLQFNYLLIDTTGFYNEFYMSVFNIFFDMTKKK